LVNNAGFGLAGEAAHLDPAEQLAIVNLNIRAVVEITLCFLPAIRAARGKILNVASVAAYFPGGPGMATYYASKSFMVSFSLALSQELHSQGVTVSARCPGYTKTDFQARAGFGPNMDLARLPGSTATEVAEAGYAGLIAGRREILPGFLNKLSISLLPFLPKARILAVVSRLQQNRVPLPRSPVCYFSSCDRCLKRSNLAARFSSSCIKHIRLRGGSDSSCADKDSNSIAGVPASAIRCRRR
jgi:hypothetical protein